MAGIGFRLQNLLRKKSITATVKAYLYSSMIVAGPMILSIITLAIMKLMIRNKLGLEQDFIIQGIYIYATAFSLIGSAPFLYVITRYLADQYFLRNFEAFTPTYLSSLLAICLFQSPFCIWFLYPVDLPFSTKILAYLLYQVTNGVWLSMIFLSAARSYTWITLSFLFGSVTSLLAGLALGYRHGMDGFLAGMVLGMAMSFCLLTLRINFEFGARLRVGAEFFLYFFKYPKLVFIGVFYNMGIWIDKFVFWNDAEAIVVKEVFRFHPVYDGPQLLAFITVFPAMAFFLITLETDFAKHFHDYYRMISLHQPMRQVTRMKGILTSILTSNFQLFVVIQSSISVLAIFFVDSIADYFMLSSMQMGVLRVAILGAYLQVTYMIVMNLLFYFDFQTEVLTLTVIYLVVNAAGSWMTLQWGLVTYGWGQALAGLATSLTGLYFLNNRVERLEYHTFMLQPITLPRFKMEGED